MLLNREQMIAVQNWKFEGSCGSSAKSGTWVHIGILDNDNIVTVCGCNDDFTGAFISDGVQTNILTEQIFNILNPRYTKR